ncbi:MAG: AMP-binding protein, partial [Candidatus Thorarchaeota archaeon]
MTYQSEDWAWIGQWSKRRAELTPNKEAIFDHAMGKRYTYDDMDDRANRLSRMLHDFGVRKGDRIAAYSKNRIEMIDLFLATGKIGAIMVPFNVRLAAPETEYLLKRTSPKILFLDPDLVEGFRPSENTLSECRIILMNQDLGDSMKEARADPIEREKLDFNDPHLIVFTGGTTGLPKGAILSHRLIFWNSVNTITSWELRSDDTQPLLFPLFHTGGWNVLLVPFYHLGARTILMGDFNPSETLQVIDREKCSIVIG